MPIHVRLFTDAAWVESTGQAGLAWVAWQRRHSTEEWLPVQFGVSRSTCISATHAEMEAVELALRNLRKSIAGWSPRERALHDDGG